MKEKLLKDSVVKDKKQTPIIEIKNLRKTFGEDKIGRAHV